jgi:aryl-alcohol dehydrogenase-like predicted oxidoreductase
MDEPATDFSRRVMLGRTGLMVSRIGLAASYGIGADAVEEAYHERGINYLYWGSRRRESFGEGIRRLAQRKREDLVIVVQSYSRLASLLAPSLESALRRLRLDYVDILLLGMHNSPPPRRIVDAALHLREQGKFRFLAVSCHKRRTFQRYASDRVFDVLMFRYNAAHRGAEQEVLPLFSGPNRPGAVSYTATCWRRLLKSRKIPKNEAVPTAGDCYRFVLTQPQVDLCLAGPANAEQMHATLAALDRGPMNAEELAWMQRVGDYIHTPRKPK